MYRGASPSEAATDPEDWAEAWPRLEEDPLTEASPSPVPLSVVCRADHPLRVAPADVPAWWDCLDQARTRQLEPERLAQSFPAVHRWLACARQTEDVGPGLVGLLRDLTRGDRAAGSRYGVWVMAWSAALLGVEPPLPEGTAPFPRDLIPALSHLDFDEALRDVFRVLFLELGTPLTVSICPGLTVLEWVQAFVREQVESAFPWTVTPAMVDLYTTLLRAHPQALEPHTGSLTSLFLFNHEHIDSDAFVVLALTSAGQTRQLPKLVSRALMAAKRHVGFLRFSPIRPAVHDKLALAIMGLPKAQVMELWKTLLYHFKTDLCPEEVPFVALADYFMGTFLANVTVLDHNVPTSVLRKIVPLIHETHTILEALAGPVRAQIPRTQQSLLSLAIFLQEYRHTQFPDLINGSKAQELLGSTQLPEVQTALEIMWVEGERPSPSPTVRLEAFPARALWHDLAQFESHFNFADLVSYIGVYLPESDLPGFASRFRENHRLQTALVHAIIIRVHDQMDVDDTCQTVLRPLSVHDYRWLKLAEDPEQLVQAITQCYQILAQNLIGLTSNPALDYVYFKVVLHALIAVPLSAIDPVLKSLAFLVNYLLLALSSFNDMSLIIAENLGKICDSTFSRFPGFKYINGIQLYFKCVDFKIVGLMQNCPVWEGFAGFAKAIVSRIHEYEKLHGNSLKEFQKLCESSRPLQDAKSRRLLIIFMDQMARPIVQKDSNAERVAMCCKYFEAGRKCLMEVLKLEVQNEQTYLLYALLIEVNAVLNPGLNERLALKAVYEDIKTQELNPALLRLFTATLKHCPDLVVGVHELILERLSGDGTKSSEPEHLSAIYILLVETVPLKSLTPLFDMLPKLEDHLPCLPIESLRVWKSVIKANLDPERNAQREEFLEKFLLALLNHAKTHGRADIVQSKVLSFFLRVVAADKPVCSSAVEAACLSHCLSLDLGDERVGSRNWFMVNEILGTILQKRYRRLAVKRIALISSVFYQLVSHISQPTTRTGPKKAMALERTMNLLKKHKEDFASIAPSWVTMLVQVLGQLPSDAFREKTKRHLTASAFKIIDLCSDHAFAYIANAIDPNDMLMVKQLIKDYKQFHRYKGTV